MIQNIDITMLNPHPNNPRTDLGNLTELVESIKARGVMQNLTVVKTGKRFEKYTVVIGHRRLAAAKLAGLTEVPCAIVDLDEKEQVATMLLENMQREDLTVYEQAQGFQMMLDFGDTVNDIAEKTGFSKTTIRHRVKLLELDPEKFKKSAGRNATLADYVKLEQIKNIELRNEVLESIGTHNFEWTLSTALDQEAMPARREELLRFLEGWAKPVEEESAISCSYIYYFPRYNLDGYEKPADADTGGYIFIDTGNGIDLRKKIEVEENQESSIEEKEFKEREARMKTLTKRAFEQRREFVLGFTGGKRKAKEIMDFAMIRLTWYGSCEPDKLLRLLGVDPPNVDGMSWEDGQEQKRTMLLNLCRQNRERTILITAWATMDSSSENYYLSRPWEKSIIRNTNILLDDIYDGLIALGYQMSDEERQLRDGTHELFAKEETDFQENA